MQKYKDFLTCANKSEELGRMGVFFEIFVHTKTSAVTLNGARNLR